MGTTYYMPSYRDYVRQKYADVIYKAAFALRNGAKYADLEIIKNAPPGMSPECVDCAADEAIKLAKDWIFGQ